MEPPAWSGRYSLYGDEAVPIPAVEPFRRTVYVNAASFARGTFDVAVADLSALLYAPAAGGIGTPLYLVSAFVYVCAPCVFVAVCTNCTMMVAFILRQSGRYKGVPGEEPRMLKVYHGDLSPSSTDISSDGKVGLVFNNIATESGVECAAALLLAVSTGAWIPPTGRHSTAVRSRRASASYSRLDKGDLTPSEMYTTSAGRVRSLVAGDGTYAVTTLQQAVRGEKKVKRQGAGAGAAAGGDAVHPEDPDEGDGDDAADDVDVSAHAELPPPPVGPSVAITLHFIPLPAADDAVSLADALDAIVSGLFRTGYAVVDADADSILQALQVGPVLLFS